MNESILSSILTNLAVMAIFDLRAIGQKPTEPEPEKEQKHGKK